jgi:hypothetical protein
MTENDTNAARTPRWVKVFGIVALALVVLVVVMLIAERGGHGPGRHGSRGIGHSGPPAGVTHPQP